MLPIFHCLTGCDSTASFSGVGKRKAFKGLKENKNEILSFFCKKNISGDKLPPTRENLLLHIFRTTYQTYPSPVESKGWVLINGSLNHQYSTKDPAPNQVAELVVWSCKSGCSSNRCSCLKDNSECSEACLCVSCENDIGFLQNRDEDDENSDDE